MMKARWRLSISERYDVIVIGPGPGKATVTREFARAGKRARL